MNRSEQEQEAEIAAVLPHIAFTSQSQMRKAIKNERRWEFAMEGYRFYDLVRWGDALSALGSLRIPEQAPLLSYSSAGDQSYQAVFCIQNPEW